MSTPSHESLRTRRRRETRHEIQLAALRLAREHGFDKVTVDMISAEAGVSPRTFFNYFPSKDAAVLPGPGDLPEKAVAEFIAAGPAPLGQVLMELTGLLVLGLANNAPQRRELHDAFELAREHPQVLAVMLAQFEAFQLRTSDLVAQRLGDQPDDEVPGLIAAVALAAMRQGLERWARADGDEPPTRYVERSAALLHTLLSREPGDLP